MSLSLMVCLAWKCISALTQHPDCVLVNKWKSPSTASTVIGEVSKYSTSDLHKPTETMVKFDSFGTPNSTMSGSSPFQSSEPLHVSRLDAKSLQASTDTTSRVPKKPCMTLQFST